MSLVDCDLALLALCGSGLGSLATRLATNQRWLLERLLTILLGGHDLAQVFVDQRSS